MVTTMEILPKEPKALQHKVALGGYLVPNITVVEERATGEWHVCTDGFGMLAGSLEELNRWIWFVAQLQARAQGYSSHGEHSRALKENPNTIKVS